MSEEIIKCRYRKQSLGEKHVFDTPRIIEDISQFEQLMDVCEAAHEDEVVILNVLCRGGCLDTTIAVYNSLRMTEATVYTVNKAVAASAGSMLLLAGDVIGVMPHAYTMIHAPAYGMYPDRSPEVKTKVEFTDDSIKSFYEDVYKGFLTDEELSDVLKGTPIYVKDVDHKARLESLLNYRKDLEEEVLQEIEGSPTPTKEELLKKTKKELVTMIVGED